MRTGEGEGQVRRKSSKAIMLVVFLWAFPLALFWGWFFLSFNDIHFGYVMLTRDVHDILFGLYGEMLGVDPGIIPLLIAKACVVDTALIGAILAFRRRRDIKAWVEERRAARMAAEPVPVFVSLQDGARSAPRSTLAGD